MRGFPLNSRGRRGLEFGVLYTTVLAWTLVGCDGSSLATEERAPTFLWISYPNDTRVGAALGLADIPVDAGQKRSLFLRASDFNGAALETISCSGRDWATDDHAIADVTERGVLTGVVPGRTIVRVRAECGEHLEQMVESGVLVADPGSSSAQSGQAASRFQTSFERR